MTEAKQLADALRPFAEEAKDWHATELENEAPVLIATRANRIPLDCKVSLADFRRAAEALALYDKGDEARDLAELRELSEVATPGPWQPGGEGVLSDALVGHYSQHVASYVNHDDADFIAAAVDFVRKMLEAK